VTDFTNFEERTPTTVERIEWMIVSLLEPDENGDYTVLTETLDARAAVLDQNGIEMAVHNAAHPRLIELGILTAEQLIAIRDLLRTFRENVEALILP
jgi:hypothetical protein